MTPRKRMVLLDTLLVVVLLLLVFNWSFVRRLTLSTIDAFYVSSIARKASATENFTPAAKDLAVLSTFANGVIYSVHAPNNWRPESIAGLNPLYWDAGPDGASVVFTSVFGRFYYRLERDEQASTCEEKVWNLLLKHPYRSKHLERVTVTESDRRHFNELAEQVITEYDSQISEHPDSLDLLRRKTVFLLLAGFHDAAISTCQQARQMNPQTGWFALTEASLLAEKEASAKAYGMLREWVRNRPDLARYFWLACFCREQEMDIEFNQSITDSLEFVTQACDPDSGATSYMFPVAVLACSKQRNDLAIMICDKVEGCFRENEIQLQTDTYYRYVVRLREALTNSNQSKVSQLTRGYCSDNAVELDSFYGYMSGGLPTRIPIGKRSVLLSMEEIMRELAILLDF